MLGLVGFFSPLPINWTKFHKYVSKLVLCTATSNFVPPTYKNPGQAQIWAAIVMKTVREHIRTNQQRKVNKSVKWPVRSAVKENYVSTDKVLFTTYKLP